MIEQLIRNWGWVAARGALAIVFGAITLFYPGITLLVLVGMFGAYAMADGVLMLVTAIANRRTQPRWGVLAMGGMMGVLVGGMTFVWPVTTALALLATVAAWAILMGSLEIAVAIRLRKEISGEWVMVLSGLLGVAFGAVMILSPASGALAVALWIGAYSIVIGTLAVVLAFRLRRWGRSHGIVAAAA